VWAPDGHSLYYVVENDGIYQINVLSDPEVLVMSVPKRIFGIEGLGRFDIDPAGTRLVITAAVVKSVSDNTDLERAATVFWWQNWSTSLPPAPNPETSPDPDS
jgi:hypothetical protein